MYNNRTAQFPRLLSDIGTRRQPKNAPYSVGLVKNIGERICPTMNPEYNWTLLHPEFRSNSSGLRLQNIGGVGYSTTPSNPAQFPQFCHSYQGGMSQQMQTLSDTSTYLERPQPQSRFAPQQQYPQNTVPVAKNVPESQGQMLSGNCPPELQIIPSVNYVNLKWEDVLGGKDGINCLRLSMAPPGPGNQISIGMGGEQQENYGSTPLKIDSQPENCACSTCRFRPPYSPML